MPILRPSIAPAGPCTLRCTPSGGRGRSAPSGSFRSFALLQVVLLAGFPVSGCGGSDAPQGDGPSLVERLLEEAEAPSGEGTAAADLSQPPVPGWSMLEPPCPFMLRLQVPPGWGVEEGSERSTHLTLHRDGQTMVTLMISMAGGDAAVADRIREAETHDASVVRLAEVRYGSITVPVHGGGDGQRVRAYPAVADWGVALQMAVVDVSAALDYDGNPLVDEETLARIAATLEPNGC